MTDGWTPKQEDLDAAETIAIRPLPLGEQRRFWVVEVIGKESSLPERGRTMAYPTRPLLYSDGDVEAFEVGEVAKVLNNLYATIKVEWTRLNGDVSTFGSVRDFMREFYNGAGEEWKRFAGVAV